MPVFSWIWRAPVLDQRKSFNKRLEKLEDVAIIFRIQLFRSGQMCMNSCNGILRTDMRIRSVFYASGSTNCFIHQCPQSHFRLYLVNEEANTINAYKPLAVFFQPSYVRESGTCLSGEWPWAYGFHRFWHGPLGSLPGQPRQLIN